MTEVKNFCGLKVRFPYMKAHYFLFNGAIAGIIPFVQVLGKQLGIDAKTYGIIYTAIPVVTFCMKFIVGWIADYTKSIKRILVFLLFMIGLSCTAVNFIPKVDTSLDGQIVCDSNNMAFSYLNASNGDCFGNITVSKDYYCLLNCLKCLNTSSNQVKCESSSGSMFIQRMNTSKDFKVSSLDFDREYCNRVKDVSCQVTCSPGVHDCYQETENSKASLIQIVPFTMIVIIYGSFMGASTTLGDAICFHILNTRPHLYGYQRLFGTMGWGIFCPIIGALNYFMTGASFVQSFYVGFTVSVLLLLCNILVITRINIDNLTLSKSIRKDVVTLLQKPEIIMFLISVFMMGSFTGLVWTFLFWYFTELHGSLLFLGVVSAVQTLVGEIPFFYFSSKIISTLGHFNSLTISFVSLGVRVIIISYITNPWWILPFEVLQGPSFGLAYATMASYANFAAVPGTEATMQGLLGGTFEGLGVAVGSFCSALSMDAYKGSHTFFGAGLLALAYAIVNSLFAFTAARIKRKNAKSEGQELSPEATKFL